VAKPLAPELRQNWRRNPKFIRYAPERPKNIQERTTPYQGKSKQVLEKTKPPSASSKEFRT